MNKASQEQRIVKVANCPSLSGKSTLTYHIGCDDKNALSIRVYANSGEGCFSQEWVAFESIQETIMQANFTSTTLRSLFQGKSINTPAFLLAALLNEHVVIRAKEKPRSYSEGEVKVFLTNTNALMKTKVSLNADDKPKRTEVNKVV